MMVTVRMCDVCRAGVDEHWPLSLRAGRDNSPTGQSLDADFCSAECLWKYVAAFEPSEGLAS